MDVVDGTQSLSRAFALLRLVAAYNPSGIRFADLVARSRLKKATVHRLLRGLEREGLIEFSKIERLYFLGLEAFILGVSASSRYGVHRAGRATLARLAQKSGDVAFLSAQRGWQSVCLHREEGSFPIRTHALHTGDRHPLGVGSGSLSLLAALPDSDVEEALSGNAELLQERYPNYTPALIRQQVAETRERGYAFNPGQLVGGSWGVAVAILNDAGHCEGALSIGAIDTRLGEARRKELAAFLKEEAARLGQRLRQADQSTSSIPLGQISLS